MGAIALGSPWLIQIRISHGLHRPWMIVGSPWLIQIRIFHGYHCPWISMADPDYELCLVASVSLCVLPDFVVSESEFHLFRLCWCHQEVLLPKHGQQCSPLC